jgi:hypothetical protein
LSRVTLCTNLFIYKSFTPPFHFSFIVMSSATSTPDCLCDNQCKLLTKGLSKFLCSTNNCNFELPLCHCKVPARIYSSKTHNYFCCRDKIAVSLFHAVVVVKYAVLDYHKVLAIQAFFIGIATIAITLSG